MEVNIMLLKIVGIDETSVDCIEINHFINDGDIYFSKCNNVNIRIDTKEGIFSFGALEKKYSEIKLIDRNDNRLLNL